MYKLVFSLKKDTRLHVQILLLETIHNCVPITGIDTLCVRCLSKNFYGCPFKGTHAVTKDGMPQNQKQVLFM